jgi:fatty acid desaturase
VVSSLYSMATHAPWREPLVVEASALDAVVPFVPAAAYLYVSYVLLLPVLLLAASHRTGFAAVYGAAMSCGVANALLYALVPTTLAERSAAPAGSLLAVIQGIDTTLGALPSGHVSLPCSIAIAALLVSRGLAREDARFWRSMGVAFGVWTLALAASTLLTRQHVAIDAVAGVLFGGLTAAAAIWAARTIHLPTLAALLFEWCVIAAAAAVALRWWSWPMAVAAGLIIASRQHALMVLFHDGVHFLAARNRRANDFIINTFAGVPTLVPLHLYRALHLSHHRDLGHDSDPERVLLYRGQPWNFRPLRAGALIRQLAGDALAFHSIAMTLRYFRERRPGGELQLPATRAYPELIVQFAVFAAAWAAALALSPLTAWHAALIWFVPFFTVTQLLQKIRSFAEHALEDEEPSRSCSWAPGVLGRLTIWPYNINYHREHHAHPSVPWDRLPQAVPSAPQRPGHTLIAHLWTGATR